MLLILHNIRNIQLTKICGVYRYKYLKQLTPIYVFVYNITYADISKLAATVYGCNSTFRGQRRWRHLPMLPKNVNLCARPTDGNDRPAHALN